MKVNNKTGEVAYVTPVKETDELLIITRKGIAIRTLAKQISEIGRNTIGVRTIRLDKDDRVMACTRIDHEDSDEEEKEEKEEQEESAGEQNEP